MQGSVIHGKLHVTLHCSWQLPGFQTILILTVLWNRWDKNEELLWVTLWKSKTLATQSVILPASWVWSLRLSALLPAVPSCAGYSQPPTYFLCSEQSSGIPSVPVPSVLIVSQNKLITGAALWKAGTLKACFIFTFFLSGGGSVDQGVLSCCWAVPV